MKSLNRLLFFVLIFEVSLLFLQSSSALFSDTAASSNNTFTASLEFPGSPPENIANHPVISEVQIDGGVGTSNNNDFIEIFNPTNSEFLLSGHRLIMRTGSSPNDTNVYTFGISDNIPAHGYYLWAHDSSNNHYADTINADVSSADTLGANNSVALRQGDLNTGTIIDALSWNTGSFSLKEDTEFSPDPGPNESMERKAYSTSTVDSMMTGADVSKGNGYDTNNNSTDFILRTASNPQNSSSPTETP